MDLVGLFSIVSLSFRDALVPRLEVKREDLSRSGETRETRPAPIICSGTLRPEVGEPCRR